MLKVKDNSYLVLIIYRFMGSDCIICGEELKVVVCSGSIKDMKVNFCYAHASFCENCEKMICTLVNVESIA